MKYLVIAVLFGLFVFVFILFGPRWTEFKLVQGHNDPRPCAHGSVLVRVEPESMFEWTRLVCVKMGERANVE